jgi:hypothetical protein
MKKFLVGVAFSSFVAVLAAGVPLSAQESKPPKPPLYIYVSEWAVPRAQWADMAKLDEADQALMDKLVTGGTLTGYGEVESIIHTEGQPTHAEWLDSHSQEGIVKAIQTFMSQPGTHAPVLEASKHWDLFLVSRLYNSRPGTYDGAYLSGTSWELKPGQYDDFQKLIKARVAPTLDKLIADGVVISYNFSGQAYATGPSNGVSFVTIVKDAEGLDQVDKAFEGVFGDDPEIGPAAQTMLKFGATRSFLDRVSHMVIK